MTRSRAALHMESTERLRARVHTWSQRTKQTVDQLSASIGMPTGTLNQMIYGKAWGFCWHAVLAKKLGTPADQIWTGKPLRQVTPKRAKPRT